MNTHDLGLISVECGYCDISGPQKIVAQYVQTIGEEHEIAGQTFYSPNEWTLSLSVCNSCQTVNLSVTDDGIDITVLYPKSSIKLQGLPTKIAKAYQAARAVRLIDTNAFAVLLGRVLELVCIDRQATGKTLYSQLQDLSGRGEIPGPLADMSNQLRIMRNVGAHAALGELTKAEVPILDELCQAILEHIYIAPNRVAKIAQHIENLKVNSKTNI